MKPKPITQIDETIKLARQYVSAVVRANVPSEYVSGAEFNPKMVELLRAHRESNQRPDSELMGLKQKLSKLNCDFVLDGEIAWSLDVLDWETKIWGPLQRWVQSGYALLFEKRPGAIWPVRIPERDLRDWQQEGQAIEGLLKDRKVIFCPDDVVPVIDEEHYSVRWKDVTYALGNNNDFRLMTLLVKTRIHTVSYATICNRLGPECAIHQTVYRLKQRLPPDLRKCFRNEGQKVSLNLPKPAW